MKIVPEVVQKRVRIVVSSSVVIAAMFAAYLVVTGSPHADVNIGGEYHTQTFHTDNLVVDNNITQSSATASTMAVYNSSKQLVPYAGTTCANDGGGTVFSLSTAGAGTCNSVVLGAGTSGNLAVFQSAPPNNRTIGDYGGASSGSCSAGSAVTSVSLGANGTLTATCGIAGGVSEGLWGGYITTTPTTTNTGFTNTWCTDAGYSHGNGSGGVYGVVNNSAGGGWHALSRPAPTPPYTIKALVLCAFGNGANNGHCGIGWSNSTDCTAGGSLASVAMICPTCASGFNPRFGNITGSSGIAFTTNATGPTGTTEIWFQISDDGTNYTAMWGAGPDAMVPLQTGTKSGGFLGAGGYTNIIIPFAAGNSNAIAEQISGWYCTGTGC